MARRLGARKLPKQKGLDYKLIQESEEPKRNPVSGAGLCLVNSQETVRLVLDLLKRFSRAADFKEIFAIYKEITFLRILQGIIRAYLICKKSFPDSPCFGFAAKGIHDIGVPNASQSLLTFGTKGRLSAVISIASFTWFSSTSA